MKEKFRFLCIVVRLSVVLRRCTGFQGIEVVCTPEGFKLVCSFMGTDAFSIHIISILFVILPCIIAFRFSRDLRKS